LRCQFHDQHPGIARNSMFKMTGTPPGRERARENGGDMKNPAKAGFSGSG
jgi:hypothetical protein